MATKRLKATEGLWRGPDGKTRPWMDTWGQQSGQRNVRRAARKGGKGGSGKSGG